MTQQQPEKEACQMPDAQEFSECTKHLLPVKDTLDVLSGKWKLVIIMALLYGGTMRFKKLQKTLPKITGKVLSKELKEMEMNKLLTRTVHDTSPITVEYALTDYGKTLEKVVMALREWGLSHRRKIFTK